MTIQPISEVSLALYITSAELLRHGMEPEDLTLERALEWTKTAFRSKGMDSGDGIIEIEAYSREDGVLVFAYLHMPKRRWFSFSSFELTIEAMYALCCPALCVSLYSYGGRYYLCIGGDAEQSANRLSEFGRFESGSPLLEAHLREYGHVILRDSAADELLRHFYTRDAAGRLN